MRGGREGMVGVEGVLRGWEREGRRKRGWVVVAGVGFMRVVGWGGVVGGEVEGEEEDIKIGSWVLEWRRLRGWWGGGRVVASML